MTRSTIATVAVLVTLAAGSSACTGKENSPPRRGDSVPTDSARAMQSPESLYTLRAATAPGDSLFFRPSGVQGLTLPKGEAVVRKDLLARSSAAGQRKAVSLPTGPTTALIADLELAAGTLNDAAVWTGVIRGRANSQAVFVQDAQTLTGSFQVADTVFELTQRDSTHELVVRLQSKLKPELPPRTPPNQGRRDGAPGTAHDAPSSDCANAVVDVLIAYTPAARKALASDVPTAAKLAVAQANTALQHSGVPHRFRLAGTLELAYNESGSLDTDLDRLSAPNDGFLDQALARRDALGADIVSVWVSRSDLSNDACGLGYVNKEMTNGARWGLNVVLISCATSVYSFAHESGHNLGMAHNREANDGGGIDPYSYGYQDPSASFRTVMAYQCATSCPRVLFYSSPTHVFQGHPVGIAPAVDASHSADNATTATRTMCLAEKWRTKGAL